MIYENGITPLKYEIRYLDAKNMSNLQQNIISI